jgi:hypothetical protein
MATKCMRVADRLRIHSGCGVQQEPCIGCWFGLFCWRSSDLCVGSSASLSNGLNLQDEGRLLPWTPSNKLWMTRLTFQGGNLKRDCTKCAFDNYNAKVYAEGLSLLWRATSLLLHCSAGS